MSARSTYSNPAPGRLSSPFNPSRTHPITGKVQPHNGADVAAELGTPVRAAHAGTVRTGYEEHGGGHWVIVTSGDVETRYLHLSRRDVTPGQTVQAGQQLGLMGTSGASTGVHLHFEVRVKGVPTDPVPWLTARGVTFGTDPAPTTITLQEDPDMIIIRKGTAKTGYTYRLVTGGRSVAITNAATRKFKAQGVKVAALAVADFDRIAKGLE